MAKMLSTEATKQFRHSLWLAPVSNLSDLQQHLKWLRKFGSGIA